MKLEIVIDLGRHIGPTTLELEQSGYAYELDYWLDLLYADPPLMLDGASICLTPLPPDACGGVDVDRESDVAAGAGEANR